MLVVIQQHFGGLCFVFGTSFIAKGIMGLCFSCVLENLPDMNENTEMQSGCDMNGVFGAGGGVMDAGQANANLQMMQARNAEMISLANGIKY